MSNKDNSGKDLSNNQSEKDLGDRYAKDLADKVAFLFQNFRKPNKDRYSFTEVELLTKGEVQQSWLWKVAHAQVSRPSLWTLKALTDFFKVDPSFWFKPLDEFQKKKVVADRDGEVIASRSGALSPLAREVILNLIDSFEKTNSFNIEKTE